MFFDSNGFWFLTGVLFVLVAAGFRAYARGRGWTIAWWKAALGILWYSVFLIFFYAWGTLSGENEGAAGFKIFLAGMVLCLVSGVGLWRLLAGKKRV